MKLISKDINLTFLLIIALLINAYAFEPFSNNSDDEEAQMDDGGTDEESSGNGMSDINRPDEDDVQHETLNDKKTVNRQSSFRIEPDQSKVSGGQNDNQGGENLMDENSDKVDDNAEYDSDNVNENNESSDVNDETDSNDSKQTDFEDNESKLDPSAVSSTNVMATYQSSRSKLIAIISKPGILAGIVGGAIIGILTAILLIMFIVYRMRKKDEGSYALEETKKPLNAYDYRHCPTKEFYA